MELEFSQESPLPFKMAKGKLKKISLFLFETLSVQEKTISLFLCGTKKMGELNSKFRGKKGPTDVLAFPPAFPDSLPVPFLGEIIVCPEVAQHQALENELTLSEEFIKLWIHGILHLMGFDHMESKEALVMEKKERELMSRLVSHFTRESLTLLTLKI